MTRENHQMQRLVFYALSLPDGHQAQELLAQFRLSIGSLRRHNRTVPAVLFVSGPISDELAHICGANDVMIHGYASYEERLARLCPRGWPALAPYPLLHRFLNFGELAAAGTTEALYLDCDTVFFGDVELLFDRYAGADLAAREEVHTSRSARGVDRTFLDEGLLAQLVAHERVNPVPPFNLGVVLFRDGLVERMVELQGLFVDYVWRFVSWMADNPASAAGPMYREFLGYDAAQGCVGAEDRIRALPYPSANRWIVDEISLWLTLGHIPGLVTTDFAPGDVALNGELFDTEPDRQTRVVGHYFSNNKPRLDAWLAAGVG